MGHKNQPMEEVQETSIEYNEPQARIQFSPLQAMENNIVFYADSKEVLRFTPNAVYFHGQKVDDKLEVYERFNEWLHRAGYPPPKPTRRKRRKPSNPY